MVVLSFRQSNIVHQADAQIPPKLARTSPPSRQPAGPAPVGPKGLEAQQEGPSRRGSAADTPARGLKRSGKPGHRDKTPQTWERSGQGVTSSAQHRR